MQEQVAIELRKQQHLEQKRLKASAALSARNALADQDLDKDMQHRIESMTESKKPRDRKLLLNHPPIKDTKLKTT